MELLSSVFLFSAIASTIMCEWVALRPLIKTSTSETSRRNSSGVRETPCPDIHNLTMLMWGQKEDRVEKDVWLEPLGDLNDFQTNMKSVPKSAGGKFAFLKLLEENLMMNIESQIMDYGQDRSARGKLIPEIPREAALISISLLLFAVYLIKLVMKVIHKIQEKKMESANGNLSNLNIRLPSGLVVSAGRKKRLANFEEEMEKIQLLQLIENYSYRQGSNPYGPY